MPLSPIAQAILEKRYLQRNEHGERETPDDMFLRVAQTIAAIERDVHGASQEVAERLTARFFKLMREGVFLPNSPLLANAGKPNTQYSACYVVPVHDDMTSIFNAVRDSALIHKQGGGTGFDFSELRPKGDRVASTSGVASGPVSFMKVFNAATDAVAQGGMRRGANMGVLRVDHPDILEFIYAKRDPGVLQNFNISVAIPNWFMEAILQAMDNPEKDDRIPLRNPRTGHVHIYEHGLMHPITGEVLIPPGGEARLSANLIFDAIVENAHATGEPGVLFIDRANMFNPVPHLGAYRAVNPCGEQWLLPYDVCNLGSINLAAFVDGNQAIHWKDLRETIHLAVRFLDNVIDANHYPLPQIAELSQRIRRIGLGVMGWADMLIRLGIPYQSSEALNLARQVMRFFEMEAEDASVHLGLERGVFPEWEKSIWGPDATCARDEFGERIGAQRQLRNCNVTTVAPTGTISIIAGCSSGIEPLFGVAFWRNQAGERMLDIHPEFVARAKAEGWYSEELMTRIANTGHIHHPEVPEATQKLFMTAHDVMPEWHLEMQAMFQHFIHAGISKTINMPNDAPASHVDSVIWEAWKSDLKGVTVYRDGSRAGQVLSTGATGNTKEAPKTETTKPEEPTIKLLKPRNVPTDGLPSHSFPVDTPLGKLRLFVTELDNKPFEVFAIIGRAGSDVMAFTEAIGRLLSLGLRCGIPVELLSEQLRGIGGAQSVGFGPSRVRSVPDAIGKVLQEQYAIGVQADPSMLILEEVDGPGWIAISGATMTQHSGDMCPECHAVLRHAEGCAKCFDCGYSAC